MNDTNTQIELVLNNPNGSRLSERYLKLTAEEKKGKQRKRSCYCSLTEDIIAELWRTAAEIQYVTGRHVTLSDACRLVLKRCLLEKGETE